VDGRKSLRLRNLAAQWLAVSGLHAREVRFDVVTVLIQADGPQIRHLRGAIS
jgi:putative endonuclease